MDDYLPLGARMAKVMENITAASFPSIGIYKAIESQQKLMQAIQNSIVNVAPTIPTPSEFLGLTKILQDQKNLIRAFQSPLLDFAPAMQEIVKQHLGLSHSMAEALKGYQPMSAIISNQLKAIGLAAHFSSIALPTGFMDTLRSSAGNFPSDIDVDEVEFTEKLVAVDKRNSSQILDIILEALETIEIKLNELLTSSIESARRHSHLVTYDRVINHLAIILSIVMYLAQKDDQQGTDEKMDQQGLSLKGAEQKIDTVISDISGVSKKMDTIQNKIESLMRSVARSDLRVCTNPAPLKIHPFNKAMSLGCVERYQIINAVTLAEEDKKKKWIYITFFDMSTGVPRSGWVQAKYFRKSNLSRNY